MICLLDSCNKYVDVLKVQIELYDITKLAPQLLTSHSAPAKPPRKTLTNHTSPYGTVSKPPELDD